MLPVVAPALRMNPTVSERLPFSIEVAGFRRERAIHSHADRHIRNNSHTLPPPRKIDWRRSSILPSFFLPPPLETRPWPAKGEVPDRALVPHYFVDSVLMKIPERASRRWRATAWRRHSAERHKTIRAPSPRVWKFELRSFLVGSWAAVTLGPDRRHHRTRSRRRPLQTML